jgi:hypothetical protein
MEAFMLERGLGFIAALLLAGPALAEDFSEEPGELTTLQRSVDEIADHGSSVLLRRKFESMQPHVMTEAVAQCPQPLKRCSVSWLTVRAVEEPAPGMHPIFAIDLAWRPVAALALTAQIVPLIPKAQIERGMTLLPAPKNGMLRLDFGITAGWRF